MTADLVKLIQSNFKNQTDIYYFLLETNYIEFVLLISEQFKRDLEADHDLAHKNIRKQSKAK